MIRSADGLSAQVSWTPQTAVPDASPVSGYSVLAIDTSVTPAAQAGVRTDAAAKQATIGSLIERQDLHLRGPLPRRRTAASASRSRSARRAAARRLPARRQASPSPPPRGATTETAVAAGLVTAAGSPAGGQIWFTDDGTAAVTGDALAETAKLYTAPVPVTAPVRLSFAYFNTDGNVAQVLGLLQARCVTAGPGRAAERGVVGARRRPRHPDLGTRDRCHRLPGGGHAGAGGSDRGDHGDLAGGHGLGAEHRVHVHRQGQERRGHARRAVRAGVRHHDGTTDRVTIGTARWKAGDFRVGGTGSVNGNTVQIYRANADGTISTQTIGTRPRSRRTRSTSASGTAPPRRPTRAGSSSSPAAAGWPGRSR